MFLFLFLFFLFSKFIHSKVKIWTLALALQPEFTSIKDSKTPISNPLRLFASDFRLCAWETEMPDDANYDNRPLRSWALPRPSLARSRTLVAKVLRAQS